MYAEFATDPKVQSLTECMQRRYVMLLCLRCNNELHGLTDGEVACAMRISEDEALKTKESLTSKGLITEQWEPTNWDKRQYVSDTSNERVKRHRNKKNTNNNINTNNINNTYTEEKSLQKQNCNVTVTLHNVDEETTSLLEQSFNDFKAMRNKIKKPMTDRAEAAIRKKLAQLASTDEEKIAIIEQSIVSCWLDVFPLRQQLNPQPKQTELGKDFWRGAL